MTAKKKPAARTAPATKTAPGPYHGMTAFQTEREIAEIDAHLPYLEAAKPGRKPKLQAVAANHEEVALAKLRPATNLKTADRIAELEAELTGAKAFLEENASVLTAINAENISLQGRLADAIAAGEAFDRLLREATAINVDLEGQLRDEMSLRTRDATALRKDLDAADIAVAQAESVTKQALHDLANARARIKDLEWRASARQFDESELKRQIAHKQERIEQDALRISELGSELDAAEDHVDRLLRELDHAQRPWIAKLFKRVA